MKEKDNPDKNEPVNNSNSTITYCSSESNFDFIDELQLNQEDGSAICVNNNTDFQENPTESFNLNNLSIQKDFIERYETNPKITNVTTDKRSISMRTARKAVSFSTLEVRYFSIILGDNPGCGSDGPPLTISWDYDEVITVSVDCYEIYRKPRKTQCQLMKTPFHRKQILTQNGFYEIDINKRMKEMKAIHKQRMQSHRKIVMHDFFCGRFLKRNAYATK